MLAPIVLCFGTAAPASILLHGSHHALTAGGLAGVVWLLAPGSWLDRARAAIGGPDHHAETVWVTVAVVASAAAAAVHLMVLPGHLRAEAGPWLAPAFALVAALQAGWAYAVATAADTGPHDGRGLRLLAAGAGLHTAVLTAWLISRTAGLPRAVYPGPTPSVGIPDLVAVVWQLAALAAIAALLRTRRSAAPDPAGVVGRRRPVGAPAPVHRWSAWPPASRLVAAGAGVSLVALVPAGGLI